MVTASSATINGKNIKERQIWWTAFEHLEITKDPKISWTVFLHITHLPFDSWGLLTAHSVCYQALQFWC